MGTNLLIRFLVEGPRRSESLRLLNVISEIGKSEHDVNFTRRWLAPREIFLTVEENPKA